MLQIKNLTKTYGEKIAVNNLNLEIKSGEICGFIGHNGAGKTTTIKACVGLHSFDSGEIYINGISVIENSLECKKITSYLPDNPDLYEHMKGIKYLNFIADIYEMSKEDRETQIRKYAEMFNITQNLAQPISSYSHGMKQKLALISAFMHKPKLILLDEPFVGLDPLAAHQIKQEMRTICDNGGAILFSTHVLEVAEKLCDKIAIIKNGNLLICGDTQKVLGDSSLENIFLELEGNHE